MMTGKVPEVGQEEGAPLRRHLIPSRIIIDAFSRVTDRHGKCESR